MASKEARDRKWRQRVRQEAKLAKAARPPEWRNRARPEEVLEILTSDESLWKLGTKFGFADLFIRNIRLGRTYADIHPEIPRHAPQRRDRSCRSCQFKIDDGTKAGNVIGCRLRIPDFETHGSVFGGECNLHQPEGQEPAYIRDAEL